MSPLPDSVRLWLASRRSCGHYMLFHERVALSDPPVTTLDYELRALTLGLSSCGAKRVRLGGMDRRGTSSAVFLSSPPSIWPWLNEDQRAPPLPRLAPWLSDLGRSGCTLDGSLLLLRRGLSVANSEVNLGPKEVQQGDQLTHGLSLVLRIKEAVQLSR